MSDAVSVLVVEDDDLLRGGLVRYLGLVGFEVTAVGDGASFLAALASRTFAVAVIDLGLPDRAGETLVEHTRLHTHSAIIVITARNTIDTRVDVYRTGADLFLGKPIDGRELAAAIGSLAARSRQLVEAADRTPRDGWHLVAATRELRSPSGTAVALTHKEYELLYALATSPGLVGRRQDLIDQLYGRSYENADRALETLVRRTRRSIADQVGRAAPILTHHGIGYAFADALTVEPDSERQSAISEQP